MSNFSNVLNARSQGLKTTAHFYHGITFTRGKNEKSETAVRTGHIFFMQGDRIMIRQDGDEHFFVLFNH